jgi:hypothetical protein
VNTHARASEGSSAEKTGERKKGSSPAGLQVVGALIVLALAAAGGWWARGVHDSATQMAELRALLDNGVKHVETALSKENLEEAERQLEELKKVAAKDGRIAKLESRVLLAQIAKAVSDGQLDHARELLSKAEKGGNVAIDDIKHWRDQLEAAQKSASASSSSTAGTAAPSK